VTVDHITGEIVAPADMQQAEARDRLARVKAHVTAAWDDLIALYQRRAWIALGHSSWDALCDAELDGTRIALPRQERRQVVGKMRDAGMSTRAIGQAVGVSYDTVQKDVKTTDRNLSDPPATVTSLDGRQRPATQPARKPNRRPLTDEFLSVVVDLNRITDKLARLTSDDRFTQNAEQVSTRYGGDLRRAQSLLAECIERINQ